MKKLYFLSLFSSSFASRGTFNDQETTPGSYCLKCEYINIEDTEALAVAELATSTNPCIAGQVKGSTKLIFMQISEYAQHSSH